MADNQEQSKTDRSMGGKEEEVGLGIKPVSEIIWQEMKKGGNETDWMKRKKQQQKT